MYVTNYDELQHAADRLGCKVLRPTWSGGDLQRLAVGETVMGPNQKYTLFIDTETTGLDSSGDEVIEVGAALMTRDLDYVIRAIAELNQPAKPLDDVIKRVTGLDDAVLEGCRFTDGLFDFREPILDRTIVVAHNAGFDRPFVERYWPVFRRARWACSASEIDWQDSSKKQEWLLFTRGYFYNAHRALDDVAALATLLRVDADAYIDLQVSETHETSAIYAVGSPFETKDLLKARGYRWDPDQKCWWTTVRASEEVAEFDWLASVYRGKPKFTRKTSVERFR